jgi:hypothetical protein
MDGGSWVRSRPRPHLHKFKSVQWLPCGAPAPMSLTGLMWKLARSRRVRVAGENNASLTYDGRAVFGCGWRWMLRAGRWFGGRTIAITFAVAAGAPHRPSAMRATMLETGEKIWEVQRSRSGGVGGGYRVAAVGFSHAAFGEGCAGVAGGGIRCAFPPYLIGIGVFSGALRGRVLVGPT